MMAVADDQTMTIRIHLLAVPLDIVIDLPLDGRLKGPAGAVAQDVVEHRQHCKLKLK